MTTTARTNFIRTASAAAIATLLALTVFTFVYIANALNDAGTTDTGTTDTRTTWQLEEDEAGWDCATMGNRICGTTQGA